MKKISVFLLIIMFVTLLVTSCTSQTKCSAYGEKQRYQRNWNR